ncbi:MULTISPECIES: aminoglycoside phosphotransferase family protein [Streptomyces]|uniref:Aminoglycoside phosphotransferase family protein n=1 Tax=Streptomyces chilikensis TaxID=1194079 RepID=A0ABV3ETC3_9ACTN|nr:aminoglycoside phosphotransferase family protein [Streptomyces sp. MJP52]MDH6228742.1 aminoglycoside phosphotransferase (APT) family kinase protein [Streptomyces sp. MJP52]
MPSSPPMHAGQLVVTEQQMTALVAAQFPRWKELPVRACPSDGTDNALFRIGDDLVARLPLLGDDPDGKLQDIRREIEAAARIAGATRVPTPRFAALGEPGQGYPLPWSVYHWIPGTTATAADVHDSTAFAEDLAAFVLDVRALDTEGRVFRGKGRGGLLGGHDDYVASCLEKSRDLIDTPALARLWERLRRTPRTEPDVWTHGDLMPGNLLTERGRLAGVIDVGQAGVADPALDLQPAWNHFGPAAREAFRLALGADDAAWDRGKGWALAQAVGCLWYYRETNPVMSNLARSTLLALLEDEAA